LPLLQAAACGGIVNPKTGQRHWDSPASARMEPFMRLVSYLAFGHLPLWRVEALIRRGASAAGDRKS